MTHKVNYLADLIEQRHPDIILITETWLNDNYDDTEFTFPNYNMIRCDRPLNKRGGGLIMYVSTMYQFSIERQLMTPPTESIWCKITHAKYTFLIGCIYKPPPNSLNLFSDGSNIDDLLVDNLDFALTRFKQVPVFVCGDFNYPAINWISNTFPANLFRFRRLIEFHSLTQLVREPTRENAVLDLILTNQADLITRVRHLEPFHNSDHSILQVEVQLPIRLQPSSNTDLRFFRDYRSIDWLYFGDTLASINWKLLELTENVNDCWSILKSNISDCLNVCAPLTCQAVSSKKFKKHPWFNQTIRLLRINKQKAWQTYSSRRTPENLQEYRNKRNSLTSATRNARAKYESNLAENISADPRKFFQYANYNKRVSQQFPQLTLSDGTSTQNPIETANVLNTYFVSVFNCDNQIFSNPSVSNSNNSTFQYSFDVQKVRFMLIKLNTRKATGPDEISNNLLKQNSYFLAPQLTKLFQLSLDQGLVPQDWKDAHVIPIHKADRCDLANNYRPISLTSCVCKVMERFVFDWLNDYLCNHSPLHPSQHGFQRAQSCTSQLLEYFNDITLSLDSNQCVDVIYLDFSKAFDKISHSLLLHKLSSRNVPPTLITWIASFLHNRKQRVCLGASYSEWAPVTSGVPQGSVLGPLLFNLFVDDIDDVLHPDVKIKKFADDTKLYIIYNKSMSAAAAEKLQLSLNAVTAWCNKWLMQLNITKCTSMFFGVRNPCIPYLLNGTALTITQTTRDLGVTVSNCGRVSQQCSTVATKARRVSGLMLRTFASRRSKVILPLLTAIIRPILEYSTPVWNPCLQKDIAEIEQVQRKVTKRIKGFRNVPYVERLRRLNLPSLQTRRLYFDMLECFKVVHKSVRSDCSNYLALSERYTRGYHCKLTSSLPPARLNVRKHFFLERVLSYWNSLPVEILRQHNYIEFKKMLRIHLNV